jgi:hypothetical protein
VQLISFRVTLTDFDYQALRVLDRWHVVLALLCHQQDMPVAKNPSLLTMENLAMRWIVLARF